MRTILVVEDEAKIREVIVSYMKNAGYRVLETGSGREAIEVFQHERVDLVLLDLMLPDLSGEDVCSRIRQRSPVPILMLTAKVTSSSKINGLSLGADDYVTKPFDPGELVARVRAVLRRTGEDTLLADRLSFREGRLRIDALAQQVKVNDREVDLTPNEFRLLTVLARHPGRTFTREELVGKVLGFDFEGDSRTIDQHIKNVRQKVEADPKRPQFIETVYGAGYRFNGG